MEPENIKVEYNRRGDEENEKKGRRIKSAQNFFESKVNEKL
jgi:hypothetical protein